MLFLKVNGFAGTILESGIGIYKLYLHDQNVAEILSCNLFHCFEP